MRCRCTAWSYSHSLLAAMRFPSTAGLPKSKKERVAFAYAYPILLMQFCWSRGRISVLRSSNCASRLEVFKRSTTSPALAIFHSLDNLHDTSFRLAFRLPELKAYLPFAVALILLWELLFPLAVFWRRVRWWLLGVGIAFHISTLFLMNIFFPHHRHVSAFINWIALTKICTKTYAPVPRQALESVSDMRKFGTLPL